MRTVGLLFALAMFVAAGLAPNAFALENHSARRESFVLGLGLGWGNAGADLTIVEKVDRENGVASDVTLGWAVRNDLVLGVQSEVKWAYLDIGGNVTTNADCFSIMVELTWYKPK